MKVGDLVKHKDFDIGIAVVTDIKPSGFDKECVVTVYFRDALPHNRCMYWGSRLELVNEKGDN